MPKFLNQVQIATAAGVPPLSVTSQALCVNLNANLFNGFGLSSFSMVGHTHPAGEISNATSAGISLLTAADDEEQRRSLNLSSLAGTPTLDIEAIAFHRTRINSGGATSTRRRLNLIQGNGISLSIGDDPTNDETDVTITATPAAHNHVIADVVGLQSALDSKALVSRSVSGALSVTGGGDLSTNRTLSLVNDEGSPGPLKYYGTNSSSAKGWHALPTPGGGNVRSVVKVSGTYNASASDSVVIADAPPSGNYVVTLPTSGLVNGQIFTVARTSDAYAPGSGIIVDFGVSTEGLDSSEESKTYIWHSLSGRFYRIDGPYS